RRAVLMPAARCYVPRAEERGCLLFVAVSVHLRLLSDEHYADLRQDARTILLGYLVAMALSLFPLIPQSLAALGQEILIGNRWFRIALFIAGSAATLAAGLALLAGQRSPLQLLPASALLLIVVSVFRSWYIVFRAACFAPP